MFLVWLEAKYKFNAFLWQFIWKPFAHFLNFQLDIKTYMCWVIDIKFSSSSTIDWIRLSSKRTCKSSPPNFCGISLRSLFFQSTYLFLNFFKPFIALLPTKSSSSASPFMFFNSAAVLSTIKCDIIECRTCILSSAIHFFFLPTGKIQEAVNIQNSQNQFSI